MEKLIAWGNKQTSSVGLGLFRILFGLLMTWEVLYWFDLDIINNYILGSKVRFYYDFLPVGPLSEGALNFLLFGLLISAVFITIGYYFRVAMTYFAFVFTYFFLLDKTFYNNHLYLLSLLSFLMIFMPMDAAYSVEKSRRSVTVSNWAYRLIQFQVVVVYFFGGVVKLNPYWLDFHPATEILEAKANNSGIEFLTSSFMIYFITYVGVIFDLLIGPLLWWKKSRKVAIVLALIFNTTNAWIFNDINIFPFFMIGALILFVDQEWLSNKIGFKHTGESEYEGKLGTWGSYILLAYMSVQLILPLRHYFMPGYADWTGEGQRFAWRMKIQNRKYKYQEIKFALFDKQNKRIIPIEPLKYMNIDQFNQMIYSPRMIVQFAEFIREHAAENHNLHNIEVKCKIPVEFNGSEKTYIFDPDLDLLSNYEKHDSFSEWINPLPK